MVRHLKENRSFRFFPARDEEGTALELVRNVLVDLIGQFDLQVMTAFVQLLLANPDYLARFRLALEVSSEGNYSQLLDPFGSIRTD
jgi:hypothetical protein